jgi:hypothetical protein
MENFRSFQWCSACVNDTGDAHFLGYRVVVVACFTGVNDIDERQKIPRKSANIQKTLNQF